MAVRLELLATLKDKLQSAKDFGDILRYFFDHFGDHAEFMDHGERVTLRGMQQLLEMTVGSMFSKKVKLGGLRILHLPEYRFYHGGFVAGVGMGNFFYFEDIQMGLVSVVEMGSSMTYMARLSMRPLPPAGHD